MQISHLIHFNTIFIAYHTSVQTGPWDCFWERWVILMLHLIHNTRHSGEGKKTLLFQQDFLSACSCRSLFLLPIKVFNAKMFMVSSALSWFCFSSDSGGKEMQLCQSFFPLPLIAAEIISLYQDECIDGDLAYGMFICHHLQETYLGKN